MKTVYYSLDNMFSICVSDEVVEDENYLRDMIIRHLEETIEELGKNEVEVSIDEIVDEEDEEE